MKILIETPISTVLPKLSAATTFGPDIGSVDAEVHVGAACGGLPLQRSWNFPNFCIALKIPSRLCIFFSLSHNLNHHA